AFADLSLSPIARLPQIRKTRRGFPRRGFQIDHRVEKIFVLCRPCSDLLFQTLRLSTIGAEEVNGRVWDGNGFRLLARTTRSAKDRNQGSVIRHQKIPDTHLCASWPFQSSI